MDDSDDEKPKHTDYALYSMPSKASEVFEPGAQGADDALRFWHSAGPRLTIRFCGCAEHFELATAALIPLFDYFKVMLTSPLEFTEASDYTVTLDDDFGASDLSVLLTWLQTRLLRLPKERTMAITACIGAITAANYLCMKNLQEFNNDVVKFVETAVRDDRKIVTAEHLLMLRPYSYADTPAHKDIINTIASAAVRPFMTCYVGGPEGRASLASNLKSWAEVVDHYDALMDGNGWYATEVMKLVRTCIRTCDGHSPLHEDTTVMVLLEGYAPKRNRQVRYRDPLCDRTYRGFAVFEN